MTKTTNTQPASETFEALRELFSIQEWKDTFRHVHNDPQALRILSVLGYGISFALGGLITATIILIYG